MTSSCLALGVFVFAGPMLPALPPAVDSAPPHRLEALLDLRCHLTTMTRDDFGWTAAGEAVLVLLLRQK